jgi:hypothetical protein
VIGNLGLDHLERDHNRPGVISDYRYKKIKKRLNNKLKALRRT